MKSLYLAVYGTLRKGAINEIQGYKHLGQCTIPGTLHNVPQGNFAFPTMRTGSGQVLGDLFCLNEDYDFFKFDRLEGYLPLNPDKSFFIRELTEVTLKDTQKRYLAWVYYLNPNRRMNLKLIPSGDWLNQETT